MINGDNAYSAWQKVAYIAQCLFFRDYRYFLKKNLNIRKVSLQAISEPTRLESPSRLLSNMFWASVDWAALSGELKDKINILDIGCGDGSYGVRYETLLGSAFGSYKGLDVYKSENFPARFGHVLETAERADAHAVAVNIVTSQSVLEHVQHDIEA